MKTHVMISAAVLAAVGTIATPSTTLAQTDAINGAWQLNREQSDDFQQKMQEAREARGELQSTGGNAGGGGRTGGGGRRGGGGGGGDFSDFERARAQEFRSMAAQAIEQFEFGAAQGMIAFRYPDGRSQLLKTDGKSIKQRIGENEDIELDIKTEWEKDKLRVVREIRGWGKIKEVYWLNDAGQLVVDTEVEMGRGGMRVELQRVYDRKKA